MNSSNQTPKTFSTKLVQFAFTALLVIVTLVLLWITLTFLSNGLNISSTALFLMIFVVLVVIGVLGYQRNYCKVIRWFQRKFPQLDAQKLLKISFITAIILGILLRLAFLLVGYRYNPDSDLSDTGFHWFFAQKLVGGIEPGVYDGGYGAFFPHLMTYSATLAGFMKIFGTGYQAILLSNLLFDLIAALAIYYLLKLWRNQKTAQIGVIIWLLNPLEIIFCAVGVSIVVTNMILALSLLLVFLVFRSIKEHSWLRLTLLSIALGVILSIGNAYRPIFTILLIALILSFILQLISQKKAVLGQICASLVLVIAGLFGTNKLIDFGYQQINPYHVPGGTGVGWNFFVGANYDSWGRWNRADSIIFGENLYLGEGEDVSLNPDLVAMQKDLFSQGLSRYGAMSLPQLMSHFVHKTFVLFADTSDTITWVFNEAFRVSSDFSLYRFLDGCGIIALFAGVVLSLLYFIQSLRHSHTWRPYLAFLMLSFCGIIAASLLVEVMHRYILPLTVFFTLFAACFIAKSYLGKKRES